MTQSVQDKAPDLRTAFPRSPNALLGDYILLARILDKCRAVVAGTQGEYKFNCPLDQRFFNFTGIDADAFQAQVSQGKNDDAILSWVCQHAQPKTQEEILAWGYQTRWAMPTDPEMLAYFEGTRRKLAPEKPYIQTWFQLLDAEEGRF